MWALTGRCDNCVNLITRQMYRYDPTTDRWYTSLPSCPQAHWQGVGGVLNGKFYVVSGVGSDGNPTRHDPATNKWTAKAPLPSGGAYRTGSAGWRMIP